MEIDVGYKDDKGARKYGHTEFFASNYLSDCQMKLDKFFYPAFQWFHLMYKDRNPALVHQECQLCNESFELFDVIVLPLQCLSREEGLNVKPHYFHICCLDIMCIVSRDEKENPKFKPEQEGL